MSAIYEYDVCFPPNPDLSKKMGAEFLHAVLDHFQGTYHVSVGGEIIQRPDDSVRIIFTFQQPGIRGQYEAVLNGVQARLSRDTGKYIKRVR